MADYNEKYVLRGNTSAENIEVVNAQFNKIAQALDDLQDISASSGKIDDVQINNNTIVTDKTANIPIANSTLLGVVKSSTTGTTSNRYYNVQVNDDGTMQVNVPWSDSNTAHSHNYGVGLVGSGSSGTSGTYTYKVDIKNETKATVACTYTQGTDSTRLYAVQLDSAGDLSVNVPWSDTKYTAGTTSKTSTKMYLVGATEQSANPQTYSNGNVYIGTDNELYSNNKLVGHAEDITTAKNRADSAYALAEGRARAVSFDTVAAMTTALKNAGSTDYKVGDNLFIKATDVPDYWISAVLTTNTGTYGYYEISALETQKIDLSSYQTQSDTNLNTTAKTVVGAINEVKTTADTANNTASINSNSISSILSGTIAVAKATSDSNGNKITTTYAKATNLNNTVAKTTIPTGTYSSTDKTYTYDIVLPDTKHEVIAVYRQDTGIDDDTNTDYTYYTKVDTVTVNKIASSVTIISDINLKGGYIISVEVYTTRTVG